MSAIAEHPLAPNMAKPKRNDRSIKIDAEVVRKATIVAAYRGITLAEYLSELARPLVDRHLREHQERGDPQPPEPTRKRSQ